MTKEQYLSELESCLKMVAPTEKREALQYVEEYFEEAGVGNEDQVVEQLGNPEDYADRIKEELPSIPPVPQDNAKESRDFHDQSDPYHFASYSDGNANKARNGAAYRDTYEEGDQEESSWNQYSGSGSAAAIGFGSRRADRSSRMGVLRIVLLVICLPLILALLAVALMISLMALLFTFMVILVMALLLLGVVIVVPVYLYRTSQLLFSAPFEALFLGGVSLVAMGLGVMDWVGLRLLAGKGVGKVIRWQIDSWKQIFAFFAQTFGLA